MWLWIVGGIVFAVVYRMAKLIKKLEERVDTIEMDLLDVVSGDISDRLREQMELISAAEERRRVARGDTPDRVRENRDRHNL